ncbi:MAG: hypothetical protein RR346_00200 [Bacteroidales bacterium]
MPTHGTKRLLQGKEQIFHHTYGWISVEEFYDLMPELNMDSEADPELEPDYISRQSGESFNHYKQRLREVNEYPEDD